VVQPKKARRVGGNIQFLSAPDGTPLWVSDIEPGSVPDITVAGIHVPVRRPKGKSEKALHTDTRTTNTLAGIYARWANVPPHSGKSAGAP